MSKTLGCAVVLIGALLILGFLVMGQYNSLVQSQEQVNTAWAQVQTAYQRRMDLIPNLVETVKGVAKFEQETYTAIAEARAKAGQVNVSPPPADPAEFTKFESAQAQLSSSLARLLAVAEAYPQLKANENFLNLQNQLEGTENRISVERRRFNEAAQAYNTKIRTFPVALIAGMLGFHARPYFSAAPAAETPPAVKF